VGGTKSPLHTQNLQCLSPSLDSLPHHQNRGVSTSTHHPKLACQCLVPRGRTLYIVASSRLIDCVCSSPASIPCPVSTSPADSASSHTPISSKEARPGSAQCLLQPTTSRHSAAPSNQTSALPILQQTTRPLVCTLPCPLSTSSPAYSEQLTASPPPQPLAAAVESCTKIQGTVCLPTRRPLDAVTAPPVTLPALGQRGPVSPIRPHHSRRCPGTLLPLSTADA
jgi:hypothetical protein